MRHYFLYNLVAIAAFFGLVCLWSLSMGNQEATSISLNRQLAAQVVK